MPVTYPLTMPTANYSLHAMEAVDGTVTTSSGLDQLLDAVEVTEPYFRLTARVSGLNASQIAAWNSFHASLRGAFGTFLATDPRRAWPIAHPGGLVGFNGTVSILAWTGLGDIQISSLPGNYVLTAGDLIEIEATSGRRTLVRALATSTAGSTRTLPVWGNVDPVTFPAGSTVRLYSPTGLFRLTSFKAGEGGFLNDVEFTARQVVR